MNHPISGVYTQKGWWWYVCKNYTKDEYFYICIKTPNEKDILDIYHNTAPRNSEHIRGLFSEYTYLGEMKDVFDMEEAQ